MENRDHRVAGGAGRCRASRRLPPWFFRAFIGRRGKYPIGGWPSKSCCLTNASLVFEPVFFFFLVPAGPSASVSGAASSASSHGVIQERLEREFDLDLITSAPTLLRITRPTGRRS